MAWCLFCAVTWLSSIKLHTILKEAKIVRKTLWEGQKPKIISIRPNLDITRVIIFQRWRKTDLKLAVSRRNLDLPPICLQFLICGLSNLSQFCSTKELRLPERSNCLCRMVGVKRKTTWKIFAALCRFSGIQSVFLLRFSEIQPVFLLRFSGIQSVTLLRFSFSGD